MFFLLSDLQALPPLMGLAFRLSRAAASPEARLVVAVSVGEAQRYAPRWTCLRAEQAAFESLKR